VNAAPMKIRLFIKPYYPWCHKAMRWLKGVAGMDSTIFHHCINLSAHEENQPTAEF